MINMLANKKFTSVLEGHLKDDKSVPESEDDVNEDAAYLDMVKELLDAVKGDKPEKALRALKMLIHSLYDEYEEEEDMYDGMKFAEKQD